MLFYKKKKKKKKKKNLGHQIRYLINYELKLCSIYLVDATFRKIFKSSKTMLFVNLGIYIQKKAKAQKRKRKTCLTE